MVTCRQEQRGGESRKHKGHRDTDHVLRPPLVHPRGMTIDGANGGFKRRDVTLFFGWLESRAIRPGLRALHQRSHGQAIDARDPLVRIDEQP